MRRRSMLYTKKKLSNELFEKPTSEYRGAPFWSWNSELKSDELMEQLDVLKAMGFGGAHIHCRTGLATPYLSDEFMELVRACVDKVKKEDMKVWLYDEDRWPSGVAGGLVTKNPKYRAKYLLVTPTPYGENEESENILTATAAAVRTGNGRLLACYDVQLNANGTLKKYKRIEEGEKPEGVVWYAYLETPNERSWFNNQTYVNTLDQAAIQEFIKVTHEAYKAAVGDEFGAAIPAIFTDEPQFSRKTTLGFAGELKDVVLPWTGDLDVTYKQTYDCDIFCNLPELIWELENEVSVTRYRYHDHIAERFASAFADTVGQWCEDNGIMLTGHMMSEPTLGSQTSALGEAMRSYRSFGLPGIDMLRDNREYTTAKQAQSAAHQYGRCGTSSELYGVTNWDFDFRGHKLQGDWQAVLGVTVRVPHLSWVSMGGEAKRDFPASISYQSPWYLEYPIIEDHFARVNTALTRGNPLVRIGVIHPIESYWLHWGPEEQTAPIREQLDQNFQDLTNWLLFTQLDFDFISESLLPELCTEVKAPIEVGEMTYDVMIVPGCETLRKTTIERLSKFSELGGKLIFMGKPPKYIDGIPDKKGEKLYNLSKNVQFEKCALINELECVRDVDIRTENGKHSNELIYQMRVEDNDRWLFIGNAKKPENPDIMSSEKITIKLKGYWQPQLYDTLTGDIGCINARYIEGYTIIEKMMYGHDSLLLKLKAGKGKENKEKSKTERITQKITYKTKVPIALSEPNVLMLDTAEYSLDRSDYQESEEILRIDNILREQLGYPSRTGDVAQPWTMAPEKPEHVLSLRFNIQSEIEVLKPVLAVEDAKNLKIVLNGTNVEAFPVGYYVDKSIDTIQLPKINKGTNVLELHIPFGRQTNTEWCYLLGDFGVKVEGCEKVIVASPTNLGFGDITSQGLPFYGGNITYKLNVVSKGGDMVVRVPNYRGSLIGVTLDGKREGSIDFAPYKFTLKNVEAGEHEIGLILFGNRVNTFGSVHNANDTLTWFGPQAWRSVGDEWCDEYRLKRTGILKSPEIIIEK